MQTITVSRVYGVQVDSTRFIQRIRPLRFEQQVDAESDAKEKFTAIAAGELETDRTRLAEMGTAIIKHTYPVITSRYAVREGYINNVETTEEGSELTRVWVGYRDYVLFWFAGLFPKRVYPIYRLLAARSLTNDPQDEKQQLVQNVKYDLNCVRDRFGLNIWDQNFLRTDAISRGRIYGSAMQDDPLYSEFRRIGTYIGVEIPIVGSNQKVKVLRDGRIQFISVQAEQLENPETRDSALDSIAQIVSKLRPCEISN